MNNDNHNPKIKFMKLFFSSLLCISAFFAYADTSISGNINVTPGSTEVYTVNWQPQDIQNGVYGQITWTVTNGVIISQEANTVTILWNSIPSYLNSTGTVHVTAEEGYVYGAEASLAINLVNFVEGILETCSGILGPAAIYENFGTGSNPGPPLTTVSTSYLYIPNCVLYPGQYTRTNSTVGCRGQWIGLPQDHTPGDVNGYMLMVDGDDHSGEVYRTTATGLVVSFGYEFSAYVANLTDLYEDPGLKFKILDLNNNLIQESGVYRIIFDPSDPWKKLSFMFYLPPGITSVQVVLVNDNNDEFGNDFVVDDLSFAPCYPPIIASFSNTAVVEKANTCDNGTVNLYSRWPLPTIPYPNPGFKWQKRTNGGSWADIPGATTMNFVQTENVAGIYEYRMYAYETSNPSQFVVSNILTYYVMKMLVNPGIYNVFNCNPAPVQITASAILQYYDPSLSIYSYTYTWAPATYLSSTTSPYPTISLPPQTPPTINSPAPPPPITYTYNLTVQNTDFGCVGSNTQTVLHYNPRKVVIPTSFSPNGDGINDLFRPLNLQDYPGGEFWVWDRWGNLIFHSTGPTLANYSWNGKYSNGQPCEIGTYTWRVAIPGCPNYIFNGNGTNNPYGNVILIR